MTEIVLRIVAILWLVFALGMSVAAFLLGKDARKALKEAEELRRYYYQKVERATLYAPCSTPPGLCPHARKVSDLDGGHYWICKDNELEQTALEEVKEGNEQGHDGESG